MYIAGVGVYIGYNNKTFFFIMQLQQLENEDCFKFKAATSNNKPSMNEYN